MRKLKYILITTMVAATIGGLIFVSCKKDNDAKITTNDKAPVTEMSAQESGILSFIDSYSNYKKGVKGENTSISVEDAIWQWETTLNYCYSFPLAMVENTRQDTLYIDMPKTDANGMLTTEGMMAAYSSILENVSDYYYGLSTDNKTFRFAIINRVSGNSKDGDSDRIEVVVTTGSETNDSSQTQEQPWYGVPFVQGDDYRWDIAASVLTNEIKDYDNRHSMVYNPCADCYTYIVDRHIESIYNHVNSGDWVFYIDSDSIPCEDLANYVIPYYEMNSLYASIMTHTHYAGMVINPYNVEWYLETIVNYAGFGVGSSCIIQHIVNVWNGTREWRHNNSFPIEMPPTGNDD